MARTTTARMFAALVPPDGASRALARRLQSADVEIDGLRWTACENWHVTLAFLAAVPVERVAAAVGELSAVADGIEPFLLRLAGAGGFPRPGRAGVVWAGVDGATRDDTIALSRLAKHVRMGLRRARLQPDRTPFRAHITLARVRPPKDVTRLVTHLAREPEPSSDTTWAVRELHLIESRLGAGPAGTSAYELVARMPLGG